MDIIYDCIIVGGGPAGMTAALYMCRAGYKTALIMGHDSFGSLGKISLIENYPGIHSISGFDLAYQMNEQLNQFEESKLLTRYYFVDVISYENDCNIINVIMSDESKISGNSLIQALGGVHNVLGLPGEEKFYGKGISFCATCDGPLYKDKRVAIIGGGNSAMDFAITLSKYCKEIDIIHRRNELRATKFMIEKVKELKNVNIILNTNVIEILCDTKFSGLVIKNNNEYNKISSTYDGCFYALGFNSKCLKNSYIENIDELNVFYAGDCIDTKYRQVITACGDGCKAALDCIEYLQFKDNI